MIRFTTFAIRSLTCALVFGFAAQSQAVLLLGTPTPNEIRNNGTNDFDGVIGYDFVLDPGDYVLDSLMFWDGPNDGGGTIGDGLEDGVTVRLFDTASGSQLLAQNFTAGTMANDGQYVAAAQAFSLTSTGQRFTLSANVDGGDNAFFNQLANAGNAGFLNTLQAAFESSATNTDDFPDVLGNFNNGFFGPNARIRAVPEPGAIAFLGLLGVVAAGRRWKKSLTNS